jgi:hypothetical protein
MRVLALNSSPRGAFGATGRMLAALGSGLSRAGAEVAAVDLARLSIAPCRACFACWARTPGLCVQKDGMAEVLPLYEKADLVLFGTPLYHSHMTATLKLFLDRTLPLVEPWLCASPDDPRLSGHPKRAGLDFAGLLVSPCALPEPDHFESLVHYFRLYARRGGWGWLGEVLRPSAEALSRPDAPERFGWYFQALDQAGEELGRRGAISADTAALLAREIHPGGSQAFRERANRYWSLLRRRNGVAESAPPSCPGEVPAPPADAAPDRPTGNPTTARVDI